VRPLLALTPGPPDTTVSNGEGEDMAEELKKGDFVQCTATFGADHSKGRIMDIDPSDPSAQTFRVKMTDGVELSIPAGKLTKLQKRTNA
jgi:uncharacterized protein (DUF39 family)